MSKIKYALSVLFSGILLLLLLCYPAAAKEGALSSLSLFANAVLPSVLPCMAVNLCLIQIGAIKALHPLTKGMCRLFHLPEALGSVLCLSWLSGAPTGAKLLSACDPDGKTALRFLSVATVMSPLYCISVLGGTLGNPLIGLFIYAVQLVSGLIPGFLYRGHDKASPMQVQPVKPVSLPRALPKALSTASLSCLTIGGSMALFGAIRGIFSAIRIEHALHKVTLFFLPKAVLSPLLSGLFEVSIGCHACLDAAISSPLRLSLLCGLCAFSGLSMVMQVKAFLPQVSIKGYLLQRLLHGFLAFSLCRLLLLLPRFPVPVFAPQSAVPQTKPVSLFAASLLFSFALLLLCCRRSRKKQG